MKTKTKKKPTLAQNLQKLLMKTVQQNGYPAATGKLINAFITEGDGFVGFKKVATRTLSGSRFEEAVLVLLISPWAAVRGNPSTKMRASTAKVVGYFPVLKTKDQIYYVYDKLGNKKLGAFKTDNKEWASLYDENFRYRVGDDVIPKAEFDKTDADCASGIHFFMQFERALNY